MTAAQQPKEYFITEVGMNMAIAALKANRLYDTSESVLKEIRTVSSPPEGAVSLQRCFPTPMCPKCPLCLAGKGCIHELGYEETGICNAGIAAIAQAAREKVLNEIKAWMRKPCYWFTPPHSFNEQRYHFDPVAFGEFLESLRQQAGEQR